MKITQKDIEALKKFKPTMDAFTAVNALVDDQATLESYQNAFTEIEGRLTTKQELEKKVDARIDAAKQAELSADDYIAQARQSADQILSTARLDADKIAEEAQLTAAGIVDRAKASGLQARNEAGAALAEIETLAENKRTEFTELADACDAKQKELDNLNRDLAAAREHIAVLLKG